MSDAPLKVLRVIARLNVGGPARQAILLHGSLRAYGFETVLVHGRASPGEADLEGLLADHGLSSIKVPELGARIRPLDDLRAFVALLRIVFTQRPDVVHTHTAKAGALGRLAAFAFNLTRSRGERCLLVHTFHGNVFHGYFGRAGSAAVRASERVLSSITDRTIVISPRQRQEIVERYAVASPESVAVVRLGLDLHAFMATGEVTSGFRLGLGFPAGSVVFGLVGRLVPIKDIPVLLEALAMARNGPAAPDIRLAIVGDGGERAGLEALARTLSLEESVRFLGWRHDLASIYEGLDAVVLSSRNEGTPVALIEAMAAGRPVVATSVGGVPDVVTDGESGLLVPHGDSRRLADAMIRLALSPADRRRFGAAGRVAASQYSGTRLLETLSTLYREGLMERRGDPST